MPKSILERSTHGGLIAGSRVSPPLVSFLECTGRLSPRILSILQLFSEMKISRALLYMNLIPKVNCWGAGGNTQHTHKQTTKNKIHFIIGIFQKLTLGDVLKTLLMALSNTDHSLSASEKKSHSTNNNND